MRSRSLRIGAHTRSLHDGALMKPTGPFGTYERSFGGACLDVAIMVVLLADMWLQRRRK